MITKLSQLKYKKVMIFSAVAVLWIGLLTVVASPILSEAQSQNARNLAGLIAVDNTLNDGGSFGSTGDDLAGLIVLQGLFPTSSNPYTNAKDLAGLIAVDNVTGGGSSGGAFTSNSDDLGSMIVLYNLFLDP